MKISFNWLKDYIKLDESPDKIGDLLTQSGLEVEAIETFEPLKGGLSGLVVGKVMSCKKHPDADKLKITTVDIGEKDLATIVCGAPNVAKGQKVIVAKVGATLHPTNGEPFKIKKAKIRGEVSEGMICAEDEIGIGTSHDGIMVLETNDQPGTPAAQYFNLKEDHIIEIGLTPNRADAISHIGVARDLKALLDKKVNWPDVETFSTDNHDKEIKVVIENVEACPRYSGVTITDVTIKESPDWLKVKLMSIGLTPINNLVDITNFVCHELGQPLHAFDADTIQDDTVIVKTLPSGTSFVTLDSKDRKLNNNDLMICDGKEKGMCLAGIFGGISSGVKETTKNVFLECACFSPDYVRKSAMHHGLKTDASFRYERGTDPNITVYALKRAALLIKELCDGKISSEITDIYPKAIDNEIINVKFKNIDRLIGKVIEKSLIFKILESLDIKIVEKTGENFTVSVPPYRVDVKREADIIEEILRIYGFNNVEVPEYISADYLSDFPELDKDQVQFRTSTTLAGMGFTEIMTNSLTNPGYSEQIDDIDQAKNVPILNKLSEELGVLRQDLLFSGLESVAYNINRKQTNLKFFEFGKVYFRENDKYQEKARLALFITGDQEDENWINKARRLEFYDLSSVVRKILNKFNVVKFESKPSKSSLFDYGLDILHNDQTVVTLGKVHNKILSLSGVGQQVFYADINWEMLLKERSKSKMSYEEISKFPEVRRDLSLVLDDHVSFDEIKKVTEKSENRLIRNINVFDVYKGENIGANKKAYAIKFVLQDQYKTLTDKAIDKTMDRLIKSFENELNAIIRK